MNNSSMLQEALAYFRTRRKTNLIIILINIAVFILLNRIGRTENADFMLRCGAVYGPRVMMGEYWRLLTAMFLHFDLQHLLYNMLCLLMLGDMLERAVGAVKYLLIYFVGGLAGNILSLVIGLKMSSFAVSAGASGAIFAVIGACCYLALKKNRVFAGVSMRRILLGTGLMLAGGFTQAGIDNAAHLGGAVMGLIMTVILAPKGE